MFARRFAFLEEADRPPANFTFDEAVFCIGSALQTWAKSLTQITAGRAIGGLGVGALRYGLDRPLDVPSKKRLT